MKRNVGNTDRVIRILIAIILVALAATGVIEGALAVAGYLIAVVMLFTAIVRFCPLYCPLKIDTDKKKACCNSKSCSTK